MTTTTGQSHREDERRAREQERIKRLQDKAERLQQTPAWRIAQKPFIAPSPDRPVKIAHTVTYLSAAQRVGRFLSRHSRLWVAVLLLMIAPILVRAFEGFAALGSEQKTLFIQLVLSVAIVCTVTIKLIRWGTRKTDMGRDFCIRQHVTITPSQTEPTNEGNR